MSGDARYLQRTIEPTVLRAAAEFPAVLVTGPRQAGKTTLLQHLFGSTHGRIALDLPDVQAAAESDPRGFLSAYPAPMILDEAQMAPTLWPYLRERIDADRHTPGQFLITGSQNLALTEQVSESLAGRVAVLELGPLTLRERLGVPQRPLWWERGAEVDDTSPPPAPQLWEWLTAGGYPDLVVEPGRDSEIWHSSYLRTYLERDVAAVRNVGDLLTFQRFMRLLAARSSQIVNLAELARDVGMTLNTIRQWLSVLAATYQAVTIAPYSANVGKRLVKRPKVFLGDTGTLCWLSSVFEARHAQHGPLAGAIFETAVLAQVSGAMYGMGRQPSVHFWRTSAGSEVDFLMETPEGIVAIEAKSTSTPTPAMARGLRQLRQDLGDRVSSMILVHAGSHVLPLGHGVTAVPLALL